MCGIFGIAILEGSPVNYKIIRNILRKLTLESKTRGGDATGYAFAKENGVKVFKHNVLADNFIALSNYKKVVRDNISFNDNKVLHSVIGHTRAETQGTHFNSLNNHPIITEKIVGVHNGMIRNDEHLFKELDYKTGEKNRIAEVDSEIIFNLINYYSKKGKYPNIYENKDIIGYYSNPTTRAIKKVCPKLTGLFSCALIDADNPKIIWLFKDGNTPLTVHYYHNEKLVIFASIEKFINESIPTSLSFSSPKCIEIKDNSGLCINTEECSYNIFNFNENEDNNSESKYNCYNGMGV